MNCETFQKLKRFAGQYPDGLEHVTEQELEQWIRRKEEVAENGIIDNRRADSMPNGILCV